MFEPQQAHRNALQEIIIKYRSVSRDKGSSLLLYSTVIALYHGHCPYSGLQIMQISLYHSCACWLLCLSRSATLRRRAGYRIPSHIKPCCALYQNYAPSGEHRRAVAHNLICTRNAPVAGHQRTFAVAPEKVPRYVGSIRNRRYR